MRYRGIRKWVNPSQSQHLLYFAQTFEEMFFTFSLDTYKPSAMNASLLCNEALIVIAAVESGDIKEPNIKHVLSELCENLEKDEIAQSLIDEELKDINAILKNEKIDISSKKTTIEILSNYLSLKKYKEKNEELLSDAIITNSDFNRIRKLARSYATTLLNFGFSDKYIYDATLKYFYHDSESIESNSDINAFFKKFPSKTDKYTVIYKASFLFEKLKDACENFKIVIDKEFPIKEGVFSDTNTRNILSKHDGVYLLLDDIPARDFDSAKAKADHLLKIFGTLFSLFHHKETLDFKDDCLIINKQSEQLTKRGKQVNAMHKCVDMKAQKSSRILNEFISKFRLEEDSFDKFTNAAQLHSLALNSGSEQNQLINLWIALESIIPTNGNVSNIENIINSTLPFLNMIYYKRLINKLIADILNWNRRAGINAVKSISGANLYIKYIKLFALEENKNTLKTLKEKTRDFHLLKDRICFFEDLFKSPKNILNGLDIHGKRVAQQIRRIYRARNLIVHTGNLPSYTSILIENLHDYLDVVIGTLIELNISQRRISTISQGFKMMEIRYSSYRGKLDVKNLQFKEDIIDSLFH